MCCFRCAMTDLAAYTEGNALDVALCKLVGETLQLNYPQLSLSHEKRPPRGFPPQAAKTTLELVEGKIY